MTISPRISILLSSARIAFTAASSAAFLLPRPIQLNAARAAASVTRENSKAIERFILIFLKLNTKINRYSTNSQTISL